MNKVVQYKIELSHYISIHQHQQNNSRSKIQVSTKK